MVGVDYAPESVELARQLAESSTSLVPDSDDEEENEAEDDRGEEDSTDTAGTAGTGHVRESTEPERVAFHEIDILSSSPSAIPSFPTPGFDVVLDKGTFDAISLSGERDADGRRVCETYASRVEPLVRDGGLVLVTSCNWTEDELTAWFCDVPSGNDGHWKFDAAGRIKYPRFRFGGQEGQAVASVCFRKTSR